MSRTTKRAHTGSKAVDSRCRGGSCRCHKEKSERRGSLAALAYKDYMTEAYCQCRPFTDVT